MIIKGSNYSIKNEILYNTKPESNQYNSEKLLHFTNKIRAIRDNTTDSFVYSLFQYNYAEPITSNVQDPNNILDDTNLFKTLKRNLFLLFVFDSFDLALISEFESYLMNNNCEIFDVEKNEQVNFAFKGGNIYFEYIYKIIYNGYLDSLSQDDQEKKKTFFNNNFKVSDFDFTVILKCNSQDRFNKIKYHLIKFLISKLEDITSFFNRYLINVLNKNSQNAMLSKMIEIIRM